MSTGYCFDYYAFLDQEARKEKPLLAEDYCSLISGFVDQCTVNSYLDSKSRNDARIRYMQQNMKMKLNDDQLDGQSISKEIKNFLEPKFEGLPDASWVGIKVEFTLQTPWYSRDDRYFHVMDNPVRKDRVFGMPYMSASAWKGLLRWTFCMQEMGIHDKNMLLHLFGNEKNEKEKFQRGVLTCYPTWFNQLGYAVINPHSRETKTGNGPIHYEIVPAGTEGELQLLYAPLPGESERDGIETMNILGKLVDAIQDLCEVYGMSAKRTSGWGTAQITKWHAVGVNEQKTGVTANTAAAFKNELCQWIERGRRNKDV